MPLPGHTYFVLLLYTHAVAATIFRRDLDGLTLDFHPFVISFIFFHPEAKGLVPVAHGLWMAWIICVTGETTSSLLSLLAVGVALATVVLGGQFVRQSQRHGNEVREAEIMAGLGMLGVLIMALVARDTDLSFLNLHLRTATFYALVWMLEIAVHQSTLLAHESLEIISLNIAFAVLALPFVLVAPVALGVVVVLVLNFGWLVAGDTVHNPAP
jgi:hypothetical protein